MSDPLDVVFVTGDEAAELKRANTARKLATYLERMPAELRGMFADEFQHISRAELAQLRSDLQAAQERIAQLRAEIEEWHNEADRRAQVGIRDKAGRLAAQERNAQLESAADELQRIRELVEPLKGQSVYDAIDALLQDASSAEIYKIDMAEQARQLDAARKIIDQSISDLRGVLSMNDDYTIEEMVQNIAGSLMRWLAANPAPQADDQNAADRFNDWRKEREEDFSRRIESAS